ncbi:MAG: pyridoxal 5'-phosphate synthase glutaminase subunit PdxT [Thaumarchaeota archaeon]|nr:pyridoxal 5'-phosphate synthase glutaminase subunit PdxT [Nitrososphaerota archaeon]
MIIGVLGFQGDIEEHIAATKEALKKLKIDGAVSVVKTADELGEVDALIVPGGESTVIGGLSLFNKSLSVIKERIKNGMPVLGTCAGMILLANRTYDRVVGEKKQPLLGVLNVLVERNSFGRQRESFEADLNVPLLGKQKFKGVFIRAPSVKEASQGVETLAKLDGEVVAVRQGNIVGTCFHPELSGDTRLHEYFVQMIKKH